MSKSKDFAKSIIEIFNSKYSLRIKYNKTCKLLSETLEAASASILLYNSSEDKLVCEGNYINPTSENIHNNDLKIVLENNDFFEFIKDKKLRKKDDFDLIYEQFKNEKAGDINGGTNEALRLIWPSIKNLIKLYEKYLNQYASQRYAIDSTSLTGRYYKSLLNLGTENSPTISVIDFSQQNSMEFWELNTNDSSGPQVENIKHYIGLPLYASGRYFGIIRIICKETKDGVTLNLGVNQFDEIFSDQLSYFSTIISLQIQTSYYLDAYKRLSPINEFFPKSIDNLNEICEKLRQVLNFNGAMIRIYNEASHETEIKGFTNSLLEYVRFLDDSAASTGVVTKFSQSFSSLLQQNENTIALNFIADSAIQDINIFTMDEEGNVQVLSGKYRLQDFEPQFVSKLAELNIFSITIVPVPSVYESYMIFTNTRNRKFITSDIEMAFLAVKNVGQEIENVRYTERIKKDVEKLAETELLIKQVQNMRVLIHQFGAPLNGMANHVDNILNHRVPAANVENRIAHIYQMIKHTIRQVQRTSRIAELANFPIVLNDASPVNLKKLLVTKSIDFESAAEAKDIKIHVLDNLQTSNEIINIDKDHFDEVITYLLDNAIKYSFNKAQLKQVGFNLGSSKGKGPGNILIHHSIEKHKATVSITNFGAEISDNEKEIIFDNFSRGKNADKFSTIGSGIGLFHVYKLLKAMNGTIEVLNKNSKTTFVVTINQ